MNFIEYFMRMSEKPNQRIIFLIYANRSMAYSVNKLISVFVSGQRCKHNGRMNDQNIHFLYIG